MDKSTSLFIGMLALLGTSCNGQVLLGEQGGDAGYESGDARVALDGEAASDTAEAMVPEATVPLGDASSNGCAVTSQSSLAGVSIVFRAPIVCSFTLAEAQAGISIPYDVVVAQDVAGVTPLPQDGGQCGQPGASGLIVFEQLAGSGQKYCLCDTGLCMPPQGSAVTLHAAEYPASFKWDGRNWNGPSDTGNLRALRFRQASTPCR